MKIAYLTLAAILTAAGAVLAFADDLPTSGPAAGGSPGWFLQGAMQSPHGNTIADANGVITVPNPPIGAQQADILPGCSHSTVCGHRGGAGRGQMLHVEWQQTIGYKPTYPYLLPVGFGGIPAVARDSKGNLWAFRRSPPGKPQLYKFGADHKLLFAVSNDVTGYQDKAHGMAVDAQDNVWICDADDSTIEEISPDGKLLKTIGIKGHRGDWDESKGQRLLWQPVMLAFAKNGDMFIGEGHANESPNDVGSPDPADVLGAARIIHLDKNGTFVNQWLGDEAGPGKFDQTHGLAIDPSNGDIWIGDREQYRIVIYTAEGKYRKTLQMRDLICAIDFDMQGNPWIATGQEGQYLKLNRDGKVLGATGSGMGIGLGQSVEAGYFVFDKAGNLYAADTGAGRITVFAAP